MSRIVYGLRPVQELLRRPKARVSALFIQKRPAVRQLAREAEAHGVSPTWSSAAELTALCEGGNHQGVAAMVGDYPYLDLETMLERQPALPALVAADSLTDPQNLGAIIRSAVVLGLSGLVLPKDRSVHITPAVVRVSAGATEHLPCAQVTNLSRALDRAKEAGLWVVGTVEQGGQHPADVDLCGPVVLVLGNEHKGVRPGVLRRCDSLVTIPSAGAIASLNVAAAAAVMFYELARQRRG